MPEMDLGRITELDLSDAAQDRAGILGDAGFRLHTYVNWPHDPVRRNQFMAIMGAEAIEDMKSKTPTDFGWIPRHPSAEWRSIHQAALNDLRAKHFDPFGGDSTVLRSPPLDFLYDEIGMLAPEGVTAGQIAWVLRTLSDHHQPATLSRAIFIVDNACKGGVVGKPKILRAWRTFKPVCHLWAAVLWQMARLKSAGLHPEENSGFVYFDGIVDTLACARDFQNWAITFEVFEKRYQRRRPLVESLFEVPAGVTLPATSVHIPPLKGKLLEEMKAYRAS